MTYFVALDNSACHTRDLEDKTDLSPSLYAQLTLSIGARRIETAQCPIGTKALNVPSCPLYRRKYDLAVIRCSVY